MSVAAADSRGDDPLFALILHIRIFYHPRCTSIFFHVVFAVDHFNVKSVQVPPLGPLLDAPLARDSSTCIVACGEQTVNEQSIS